MRFDDMVTTLLDQPDSEQSERIALWRQLVDVVAQGRVAPHTADGDRAIDTIRDFRSLIPLDVRRASAQSFTGLKVPPVLIRLFAEDVAAVSSPVLRGVRLSGEEWRALIPSLGPTARGLLRNREDLPYEARMTLDSFGPNDLVLEADPALRQPIASEITVETGEERPEENSPPVPAPSPESETREETAFAESQISELMARIDAYHARGGSKTKAPARGKRGVSGVEKFRFESGPDGLIRWAEGGPGGLLIGETIAVAARELDHGVDGYVAGAHRQRAPFRDARLTVAGGPLAGEWRISGSPVFDRVDGRFMGYRCAARRPRADEVAAPASSIARNGVFGSALSSDSLRQLVHELRTPLNAILGFSEMIEGQFLGPAASSYRNRASEIGVQGRRLLEALEDLETAAKLDNGGAEWKNVQVEPASLLERLHDDHQKIASNRGFKLRYRIATGLGAVMADDVAVERMFSRLLSATLALAKKGESITVELNRGANAPETMALCINRPAAIEGRDERTLLDPGYHPNGDSPDAPVLGLGFALRLVRSIAASCGGRLDIGDDKLTLSLPLREVAARTGDSKG